MFEIKAREKMVERALLVGAYIDPAHKAEARSLLEELEELVNTLGIPVVERMLVFHRESHARYLVGTGKAQELADLVKKLECDVIIFDIFGARARTREARIQVDLARMEYSLPRLSHAWSHLGQQGGGIGAKGE